MDEQQDMSLSDILGEILGSSESGGGDGRPVFRLQYAKCDGGEDHYHALIEFEAVQRIDIPTEIVDDRKKLAEYMHGLVTGLAEQLVGSFVVEVFRNEPDVNVNVLEDGEIEDR